MPNYLKSQAPPEIRRRIGDIEAIADCAYQGLPILNVPANLATWACLTGVAMGIENERKRNSEYSQNFRAAMLNYGRIAALLVDWVRKHGKPSDPNTKYKWNSDLGASVSSALWIASNYDAFLAVYPAWHKGRYRIELVNNNTVKCFTATGIEDRRVSAHQKGIRPGGALPSPAEILNNAGAEGIKEGMNRILKKVEKYGSRGVRYNIPNDMLVAHTDWYFNRLDAQVRRLDTISLGTYTIKDARKFYAALRALCDTHQYICIGWEDKHGYYPIDSAVIVKTVAEWKKFFLKATALPEPTVTAILNDLTMDSRVIDLHVHPFVRLDPAGDELALAAHFPLNSRPDDNLLRICSYVRPEAFSAATLSKEQEMRVDLVEKLSDEFSAHSASISIRNGDIDFVVEDDETLVVAQLKWLRKPVRVIERIQQDDEIRKGITQAEKARSFLLENPRHLKERGIIKRSVSDYKHVHHVVIARDHFIWADPANIPVIDHDTFRAMLTECHDLNAGVSELIKFDWLPVEGKDFHVEFQTATANGVTIECETWMGGDPSPSPPS